MTVDPVDFTQRYEELRAAALARTSAGHGMALLQHRGIPAWLEAWNALSPPPPVPGAAPAAPLPAAAGGEIALVLMDMALAALGR